MTNTIPQSQPDRHSHSDEQLSDEELLSLLAADLDLHFELLVQKYSMGLYGYTCRETGNALDGEDALQEILVKAYRALQNYPATSLRTLKLRAWLFGIAHNVLVDFYHRRKRLLSRPSIISENSPLPQIEANPDEEPENVIERIDTLTEAFYKLPNAYRRIAVLHFIEGRSQTEIAEELNKPLNTVKSAIHRSKTLLRKALEERKDHSPIR